MTKSLKEKTVKGVTWSLTEKFGTYGLSFVTGIILARLLTPEDYGLIGMTAVFFAFAEAFVRGGFGSAYIQKKQVNDKDANTVFYTNLAVSLLFYVLLYALAPLIADFFEEPRLVDLVRVMSLMIIINAFSVIQIAQLTKNINFKRKTKYTIIAVVISGAGGITAAYLGLGVWSLVIQRMGNRLILTLGLWVSSKWKPALKFSVDSFKTLFSFGSWMLASALFHAFSENLYKLAIGKFFPAGQLGFFTKARQFQLLASERLIQAIQEVAFPVLSKYQDNSQKIREILKNFLQHTMFLITPIMVTFIVVAKPFVLLLLTEKWAPMIPFLQLFCIVGLVIPLYILNRRLILALGKSKLAFYLSILLNILRILNIIISIKFGVHYIIIGELVAVFLTIIPAIYYINKMINFGLLKQLNSIKMIAISGGFSGVLAYLISSHFENLWIIFSTGVLLTIGIYIASIYLFSRTFFYESLNLKNYLKK